MYLNKTQLIERGWSLRLIRHYLGDPDDVKKLGRYAVEHRYWLPRVETIEKRDYFQSALKKTLLYRGAGKLAAQNIKAKRLEAARAVVIRVRHLPEDELTDEAIEHFNCRRRFRRDWDDDNYREFIPADKSCDSAFLDRITVNYVRHQLTSYDGKLRAQKGKIGGGDAVPIIRRRVFEEIACVYPHLERECDRQMLERELITEIEIENKYKPLYEQLELPFASL